MDIVLFRNKTTGVLTIELPSTAKKEDYERLLFKNYKVVSDSIKEKEYNFTVQYPFEMFQEWYELI
jgi:hypothetical protein